MWTAALMGSMEARGISLAQATGHCLFLSQSVARIAGLSAPVQEGRPPTPQQHLQVILSHQALDVCHSLFPVSYFTEHTFTEGKQKLKPPYKCFPSDLTDFSLQPSASDGI